MAVESRTVGQLVARVHHGLADTASVDPSLGTEIRWALTYAMRQMVLEADHPAFRTDGAMTLTAGVDTCDLPDDFIRMIEPGVAHTTSPYNTLELLDQQTYDRREMYGHATENPARPRWYILRGRNKDWLTGAFIMKFVPVPDDTYPLRFSYFASPSDMTTAADGDEIDQRFPRDFVDGIVEGAKLYFPQYLEREQRENALFLFDRAKRLMKRSSAPYTGKVFQNRRFGMMPHTSRTISTIPDPGEIG